MADIRDAKAAVEVATDELLVTLNGQVELLERMTGEIKRYHAWHLNREQTVADHVWHVMRLYVRLWGRPNTAVFYTMLFHEDGEMVTGDMQHPVKRYVPALREVSAEADIAMALKLGHNTAPPLHVNTQEQWRMKLCDLLEMYEFATRELMNGNHHTGHAVRFRILKAVRAMCDTHPGGIAVDGCKTDDIAAVVKHIDTVDKWMFYRSTTR